MRYSDHFFTINYIYANCFLFMQAFKKLYKIVMLEKYLPNKLPLSLTKPDKWLPTFVLTRKILLYKPPVNCQLSHVQSRIFIYIMDAR